MYQNSFWNPIRKLESFLTQKYINKIAYLITDKTLVQHIIENERQAIQKHISQQRMPAPCHTEDEFPSKGHQPLIISPDAGATLDPFY